LATVQSRLDLHCHTTASDGYLSPEGLVAHAASIGLRVVAITDHDTTAGVEAALAAARLHAMTVVPGVEISTLAGREEIHILGYFVDVNDAELQELLVRTRERRRDRALQMLTRLAELGLPVAWDQVLSQAAGDRSVGRAHVAMALLEAGHVSSFDEAFSLWIGRDCPAYVERFKLSPEEAIQFVQRSGGIAVLAHPYTYSRSGQYRAGLDLKRWLPRLRAAGLMGIEAFYPHYPHRVSRRLLALAVKHDLLITGGSDFHGKAANNGLGSVDVPWPVWKGLERRRRLIEVGAAWPVAESSRRAAEAT
jgi:hypothetical protein